MKYFKGKKSEIDRLLKQAKTAAANEYKMSKFGLKSSANVGSQN